MKTLRLIAIATAFVIGGSALVVAQDRDHDGDRDWKRDRKEQKEREKERREREKWQRQHGSYGQNGTYQQYPNQYPNSTSRYPNGTYPNGTYRYPNGTYPNGTSGTYGRNGGYCNGMSAAQQFGYQDGVNEGANDRATGHSFRPTHDRGYQLATNGCQAQFGSREQYKAAYRQAYQQGYQQGFNGNGSYGGYGYPRR